MKSPRIEEMVEKIRAKAIAMQEQYDLPETPDYYDDELCDFVMETLTEAHQAGIDEAVEKMEKEIDGKLETWASLEHSRWLKWQAYLHSKLYEIDDNRVSANNHLKILPTELWQRWERQIMTAYSDLSEAEKESDREQVRPYIEDLKRAIKALQNNK